VTDIFVIAEEELVIAFRLAGVDGEAVSNRDEALAAFRRATKTGAAASGIVLDTDTGGASGTDSGGVRVLALGEDVADMLGDELLGWQLSGEYPLVVEIPPLAGSRPGRATMTDAVRRAVGISI